MKHNNFTMNNTNENGMVTKIEFNGLKTKVSFGYSPENVGFLGEVDMETFKKINAIAQGRD